MASYNTLVLTIEANKYYSLDVSNDGKTRKYVLNTAFNIQLAEYTSTKKVTINNTTYELSIQDLSFKKKMYEAGEINVVIQFSKIEGTSWVAPDRSVLEKVFKKKKVTLSWGTINDKNKISAGEAICQGYYVHELSPRYMSDSMTLTLKIYSPDKVMALGKHCKSWVSSQLGADVFMKQLAKFKKPYLKDTPTATVGQYTVDSDVKKAAKQAQEAAAKVENERDAIEGDVNNLAHLKVDTDREAIFPYLVQYNESFWDFMVRSTNRWGEFLYYEGGKLHIGFNKSSSKKVRAKNSTEEADFKYNSITYCDLNESPVADEDNGEVCDGVSYDAHMDSIFLEKSKYDAVKGVMGCSIKDGGDTWTTKIIGNLLSSGKNIFDFLVDTIVDEGIALGQVQKRVNKNNGEFDKTYFSDSSNSDAIKKAHYSSDGNSYNQFGAANQNSNEDNDTAMANYKPFSATVLKYVPDLTPVIYKAVRQNEEKAAQNAVCIDFDTNFANLSLGQVFTIDGGSTNYIVTQVNTKSVVGPVKDPNGQEITKKYNVYEVYAIAETGKNNNVSVFYPTPSPAGHIRFSAPQRAIVCDAKDPSRQGRVRVRYDWQVANKSTGKAPKTDDDGNITDSSTDVACTPWLVYAQPGGKKGTGSFYRHYVGELVLVDFADGNVERPYVVGALYTSDQTLPASTYTNNIVHVTPGGQAIKMSDGTGAGFTAWMASMSPSWKIIQGFAPGEQLGKLGFEGNESFEGSIELCDKYGMYSIKGSSDGRNVSVKSPYGDIKLSAFTGITISAPNGDVKIQGKNVTIEAGNNLTLTSGKNIKNKFYTTNYGESDGDNFGIAVAAAVTKKLSSLVGGFVDLTIVRHTVEVFLRPVEGKLQVKSNRYLALEAGKGKTAYPTDAYTKPVISFKTGLVDIMNDDRKITTIKTFSKISDTFKGASMVADIFCQNYFNNYNGCHDAIQGLKTLISKSTRRKNSNETLPCKKWEDIIDDLWKNTTAKDDVLKNLIGFTGVLVEKDSYSENELKDLKQFYIVATRVPGQKRNKMSQGAVVAEQVKRRAAILKQVKLIQSYLLQLSNLDIKPLISGNGLIDNDAQSKLSDIELPDRLRVKGNQTLTHFSSYFKEDDIQDLTRLLRRKYFVKLVEDVFKIPREEVGAVNGVGGAVPAVPDFNQAFSEDDWKNYVDSIKEVYKHKKNTLADTLTQTFQDTWGSSVYTFLDEMQDWAAFGPNKSGKILFSDGGRTKILGSEIQNANIAVWDNPEIIPNLSESTAKTVRELMKA